MSRFASRHAHTVDVDASFSDSLFLVWLDAQRSRAADAEWAEIDGKLAADMTFTLSHWRELRQTGLSVFAQRARNELPRFALSIEPGVSRAYMIGVRTTVTGAFT